MLFIKKDTLVDNKKPWYGGGGGSGDLLDLAGLDGNLDGHNAGLADLVGQNGDLVDLAGQNDACRP